MEPSNPEQLEEARRQAMIDLETAPEFILIAHFTDDEREREMATHIVVSVEHFSCFMEELQTSQLAIVYQHLGDYLSARGIGAMRLTEEDLRSFLDSLEPDAPSEDTEPHP